MHGKRYLLDTNAIIQLLKGNVELITLLTQADFIATSVISRLEFLSFSGLSNKDKKLYERFEERISIIDLSVNDMKLLNAIIEERSLTSLKLPDAIISSSAYVNDCILLTADQKLLNQSQCETASFELV